MLVELFSCLLGPGGEEKSSACSVTFSFPLDSPPGQGRDGADLRPEAFLLMSASKSHERDSQITRLMEETLICVDRGEWTTVKLSCFSWDRAALYRVRHSLNVTAADGGNLCSVDHKLALKNPFPLNELEGLVCFCGHLMARVC